MSARSGAPATEVVGGAVSAGVSSSSMISISFFLPLTALFAMLAGLSDITGLGGAGAVTVAGVTAAEAGVEAEAVDPLCDMVIVAVDRGGTAFDDLATSDASSSSGAGRVFS